MAEDKPTTDPTQTTAAEATSAPAAPVPTPAPATPDWSVKRQLADVTRAAQAREAALIAEKTELQNTLADLRGQQAQLDPESSRFEDAVTAINTINARLTELAKQPAPATPTPAQPPAAGEPPAAATPAPLPNQAEREAEGARVVNQMMDKLDSEYGPQFRNQAFANVNADFSASAFNARDPQTGEFLVDPQQRQEYIEQRFRHHYHALAQTTTAPPNVTEDGPAPLPGHSATGGAPGGGLSLKDIPEGPMSQVVQSLKAQNRQRALTV